MSNFSVLVVEPSELYQKVLNRILTKGNHSTMLCRTYDEAVSRIDDNNFDIIISETDLNGEKGFELIDYVQNSGKKVPFIFVTDRNVDDYFKYIVEKQVSNILPKPVKRDELLLLMEKLVTKQNLFGLKNYLIDAVEIKSLKVSKTSEIAASVDKILDYSVLSGFSFPNLLIIKLIFIEMLSNALYHSHGYSKEKKEGKYIELKEGRFVGIEYGFDKTRFGISIADSMGKLTQKHILNTLGELIEREKTIQNFLEKGRKIPISYLSESGRGIDLTRRLSGEAYFILHRQHRTEIVIIFDSDYHKDDNLGSLKIIEIT